MVVWHALLRGCSAEIRRIVADSVCNIRWGGGGRQVLECEALFTVNRLNSKENFIGVTRPWGGWVGCTRTIQ